jgi:hypothetical protein
MKIGNVNGLSTAELQDEVMKGARLVYYTYTVSFLLITFNRKSELFLVRNKPEAIRKGIPYLVVSFLLGWWGIPSGPKETMKSISINKKGGKDITEEVLSIWAGRALFREAEKEKAVVHQS